MDFESADAVGAATGSVERLRPRPDLTRAGFPRTPPLTDNGSAGLNARQSGRNSSSPMWKPSG
jgi:hypothetical protein